MAEVLLRRGALGDVVLLGAVIGALRAPAVVTAPPWVPLMQRFRGVGEVIPWTRALRALPAGDIIDLQGGLSSRSLIARAGRSAAARVHKRSVLRRLRVLGIGRGRPRVVDLYAEAAGVFALPPPWIVLPQGSRAGILLLPGASTPLKRWDHFRALAESLEAEVWVAGGPGDAERVAEICRGLPRARPVVEAGFSRLLDVLPEIGVAVGGDTGLTHLAAAAGVPVVTIFGPTHPDDGFAGHRGEVVSRALPCRPCTLARATRCRRGDHTCMDIEVEVVREALWRQLGRS